MMGSFWTNVYQGADFAETFQLANGQEEAQAHLNLLEAVAAVSRFTVPIFHTDNWYFLSLKESDLNKDLLQYGSGASYGNQPDSGFLYQYSEPAGREYFTFPIPDDLRDVQTAFNRVSDPSLTLSKGVDYSLDLERKLIILRDNPFNSDYFPRNLIYTGSEVTDREIILWCYNGEFDWDYEYEHFGNVLSLNMESSEGYRALVNSIFDAYVRATSAIDVIHAMSAMAGIPVVRELQETVELVQKDINHLIIATDKHAYKYHITSDAVVSVGDTVYSGDCLSDSMSYFDLNRGEELAVTDVVAISMGEGFMAAGYIEGVTFYNKEVDLVVESDVNGITQVSFELGGYPEDIEQFWTDVHTKGLQSTTLARLLDVRGTDASTEPTAASLPATINPMNFLVANLLRFNTFIIKVRVTDAVGGTGLKYANILRRIIPPWTAMILIYELDAETDVVTMDGPGDETSPGYLETLEKFSAGEPITDNIDPATFISEQVTLRLVAGVCK